jgi:WD40 repeat protein
MILTGSFNSFVNNCVSAMKLFQIDAHVGNVSDLAFSHRNRQLCFITCGEDKTIKVYFIWHVLSI